MRRMSRRVLRIMTAFIVAMIATPALCLLFALFAAPAHAADVFAAPARIPAAAQQHRRELTRIARQEWGVGANVALAAAQIHQESGWRTNARSAYAEGLAQFTPETAAWIVQVYPDLGDAAPYSPTWAMRALLRYDRHLYVRVRPFASAALSDCERRAMQLAAYNGGDGYLDRDRRLALSRGANPDLWWGNVELHSTRARNFFDENRGYPRRILRELEPLYLSAGWPGRLTC